jgi:hypothetical protein
MSRCASPLMSSRVQVSAGRSKSARCSGAAPALLPGAQAYQRLGTRATANRLARKRPATPPSRSHVPTPGLAAAAHGGLSSTARKSPSTSWGRPSLPPPPKAPPPPDGRAGGWCARRGAAKAPGRSLIKTRGGGEAERGDPDSGPPNGEEDAGVERSESASGWCDGGREWPRCAKACP